MRLLPSLTTVTALAASALLGATVNQYARQAPYPRGVKFEIATTKRLFTRLSACSRMVKVARATPEVCWDPKFVEATFRVCAFLDTPEHRELMAYIAEVVGARGRWQDDVMMAVAVKE